MELTTNVDKRSHIAYWIKMWNGWSRLTDKEQEFLTEIVSRAMSMIDGGVKEPYLGQLLFSTNSLNDIKEKLSLSKQGLNNYKTQLKNKGVIYQDDDGVYHLDPKMYPQLELNIKFNYE